MKRLTSVRCRQGIGLLSLALLALTFLGPKLCFAQYFEPPNPAGGLDGYVTTAGCYSPLSGTAIRQVTDLQVLGAVGTIGLRFTRIYNSAYLTVGSFYSGSLAAVPVTSMGTWGNNWDYSLSQGATTSFALELPGGANYFITAPSQNTWQTIPASNGLQFMTSGATASVLLSDGTTVVFTGVPGMPTGTYTWTLEQLIDPYGQAYTVQITSTKTGQTVTKDTVITEPAGRWIQFTTVYTPSGIYGGTIQQVTTSDGQTVNYSYGTDPSGNRTVLKGVTYADGSTASETYQDDSNGVALLLQSTEPRYAGPMKTINYGFMSPSQWYYSGMVATEGGPNGALSTRSIPSNSTASAPIVVETRPDGSKRTFNGNSSGLVTRVSDFLGITTSCTYNGNSQVLTAIDGNGVTTSYQRESVIGAVTEIDRNGRALAIYTYNSTQFPYYVHTST
ncbi:MAG: hypothetical protein JOZ08_05490, partial [Verrucomicrobia bacterium]|nr:hypothetical protein [Verrucomicrobiota bacterium]